MHARNFIEFEMRFYCTNMFFFLPQAIFQKNYQIMFVCNYNYIVSSSMFMFYMVLINHFSLVTVTGTITLII